jgi:hypothetical protein
MVHCFPLLAPLFPEATEALAEICAFITARVSEAARQPLGSVPTSA